MLCGSPASFGCPKVRTLWQKAPSALFEKRPKELYKRKDNVAEYQKHLYAIMHPNPSLVASQLEPLEFGRQYSVGTKRFYQGKLLFIEVDLSFRHPFFLIDEYLEKTVAKPDGRPKRTKIISSYRVLEHLDLDAMGSLYAVTLSGQTLRIDKTEYVPAAAEAGQIRLLQEINPLELLVATTHDHRSFGALMTSKNNPKGSPKLFYTELDLDVDGFLQDWEVNPFLPPPIPGIHPQKLSVGLNHLKSQSENRTTTLGLSSVFDDVLYRSLKNGFFLSEGEKMNYYPFPSEATLKRDYFAWYKSTD